MNIKYHLNRDKLGERDVMAAALAPAVISITRIAVHSDNPYNAIVRQQKMPQQIAVRITPMKKSFLHNAIWRG